MSASVLKSEKSHSLHDECMEELMNYCGSEPKEDELSSNDFKPGHIQVPISNVAEGKSTITRVKIEEKDVASREKIHHKFVIVGDSRMEGIAGSWKFSKGAQTVKVDIEAFCKIGATCDSLEELLAHKNLHEADALFICLLHSDITTGGIGKFEASKRLTMAEQLTLAHKYLSWMDYLMSRFPQLAVIFMMPPIFDFLRYNGEDNGTVRADTQCYIETKTRIKHFLEASSCLPIISLDHIFSNNQLGQTMAIPFNMYSIDGLNLHHVGFSLIVKNLPTFYFHIEKIQKKLFIKRKPRIRVNSYQKFTVSLPDELSSIFPNCSLLSKTILDLTYERVKEVEYELNLLHCRLAKENTDSVLVVTQPSSPSGTLFEIAPAGTFIPADQQLNHRNDRKRATKLRRVEVQQALQNRIDSQKLSSVI